MTEKKRRRRYDDEFKREAVALVTEQGYSISAAAKSLDINANKLGALDTGTRRPGRTMRCRYRNMPQAPKVRLGGSSSKLPLLPGGRP